MTAVPKRAAAHARLDELERKRKNNVPTPELQPGEGHSNDKPTNYRAWPRHGPRIGYGAELLADANQKLTLRRGPYARLDSKLQ